MRCRPVLVRLANISSIYGYRWVLIVPRVHHCLALVNQHARAGSSRLVVRLVISSRPASRPLRLVGRPVLISCPVALFSPCGFSSCPCIPSLGRSGRVSVSSRAEAGACFSFSLIDVLGRRLSSAISSPVPLVIVPCHGPSPARRPTHHLIVSSPRFPSRP